MTERDSSSAASSKGLTVDEILKKYPKRAVDRVICDPDYIGQRYRTIMQFNEMIASGRDVEPITRARDEYLQSTPPEPPIDPKILWRIIFLKYQYYGRPVFRPKSIIDLDNESVDPDELVNCNAILNAYRCGELKVVFGEVSVWFAGHLVIGPLPSRELDQHDTIAKVSEWRDKYGPGRTWKEWPGKIFRG